MAKIIHLHNEWERLGVELNLPRIGGSILNWSALPWETLMSWFKWEDDIENRRLYCVYQPPINKPLVHYYYMGRIYYDYKMNIQKSYIGKELEVVGFIKQCKLGVFEGKSSYDEKFISPKNGLFINQISMERLEKGSHYTYLENGEAPFYIDYSTPSRYCPLDEESLNKMRELKRTAELGKNAHIMLEYLLEQYGLSENDLF